MKIFTSTKNESLAQKISSELGLEIGKLTIEKFKDGEIMPTFKESIRDEDIFLLSQCSTSDDIMATLLSIDASKRCGAKSINLILPYYPYSRADKVDHIRSSIGAKMIADVLQSVGVNRIITIELHNSAIQAFFNVPVIHLDAAKIFVDYIKSLRLENLTIVSPDQGGVGRAIKFAKFFTESQFAMINKRRVKPNEIFSMDLVGNVQGRNVVVYDDLGDTLGTVKKSAEILMNAGALSVRAIVTHPVLSGNAMDNLNSSVLTELIVSDTINTDGKISDKLKIISCASFMANALNRLETKKSISELNSI